MTRCSSRTDKLDRLHIQLLYVQSSHHKFEGACISAVLKVATFILRSAICRIARLTPSHSKETLSGYVYLRARRHLLLKLIIVSIMMTQVSQCIAPSAVEDTEIQELSHPISTKGNQHAMPESYELSGTTLKTIIVGVGVCDRR